MQASPQCSHRHNTTIAAIHASPQSMHASLSYLLHRVEDSSALLADPIDYIKVC
jgi:hypothetical protein